MGEEISILAFHSTNTIEENPKTYFTSKKADIWSDVHQIQIYTENSRSLLTNLKTPNFQYATQDNEHFFLNHCVALQLK